jgi:rRNA-processing protein FCF1
LLIVQPFLRLDFSEELQCCFGLLIQLSITKALYKKLEVTKRAPNMQCELTGGGIVLTADTAIFELIRTAAVKSIITNDSQ